MDQISEQIEAQEKISRIVKLRQEQISELKLYYDSNNNKFYKDITKLGKNLQKFENLFTKYEYRLRCENIISLSLSLGKIIDLNNSVKIILIAGKIFEEHHNYLKNKKNNDGKTFISKLFEKNSSIPLTKNELIKERLKNNWDKSDSFKKMANFYDTLFKNDSISFPDFNSYLTFQKDSKVKVNNNFKIDDFNKKLDKIMSSSYSYSNKFYSRVPTSFELDYPSTVYSACDIFFMLYNKMMDKVCYNTNILQYISELDKYIFNYFINPCSNDLIKLSQLIVQKEIQEININLDKFFN
jgi:hypothetical protein